MLVEAAGDAGLVEGEDETVVVVVADDRNEGLHCNQIHHSHLHKHLTLFCSLQGKRVQRRLALTCLLAGQKHNFPLHNGLESGGEA